MKGDDVKAMAQEVQDRIREAAYLMWESAGRQHGMAVDYWVAAEQQVLDTMGFAARLMSPRGSARPLAAAAVPAEAPAAIGASPAPVPGAAVPAPESAPETAPETAREAVAVLAAAPDPDPAKAAAVDIRDIEGIGPAYARKLASAGITSPTELLDACATAKGRQETADATGLSAKLILRWTNMADLMRIPGVTGNCAELLEAAGVDTVKELRNRRADALQAKMAEVNAEKNLARIVPDLAQVTAWVEAAKSLPPKLTY